MKSRSKLLIITTLVIAIGAVAYPVAAVTPGSNGRIAFCRFNSDLDSCDLYTVNADGTGERLLFAGPAEGPHWSPDGGRIAMVILVGDTVLTAIVNPDGSGLVQLNADLSFNVPSVIWSPNGQRLAGEAWSDVDPAFVPGMFTKRASDGGDLVRVTTNPYGGHDIPADYSPDGSRLLFLRENPLLFGPRGAAALFVVNTDGTGVAQLTPWGQAAGTGSWSPDGAWILFASASNRPKGALWVVHPDGSNMHKIFQDAAGGVSFDPAWSPDGARIVFGLNPIPRRGGQNDLYSIHANGTGLTQMTHTADFEERPDWGTYSG